MDGAAGKRKDLMNNIRSRLNADSYNVDKYYKKNEKDLKDKIKFFEKKIAAGEMKPFMSPRFEQAKAMLAKLMAMKGMAPPGLAVAAEAAANLNAPLNLLAPEPAVAAAAPLVAASAPKKARTYKKKAVAAVPMTVGEPPAALNQPLRIRIPSTRRGRPKAVDNSLRVRVPGAKLSGIAEVSSANEAGSPLFAMNAAANAGSLALPNLLAAPAAAPKPFNPFNSPAGSPAAAAEVASVNSNVGQTRRKRMPQVMNEHLLKAISETEHLIPEMYDPYTGLKFGPDESPMEKIEQAYRELQKLRANTWKKASTYRRKAVKKGGRRH
jgi:hypothetical protein